MCNKIVQKAVIRRCWRQWVRGRRDLHVNEMMTTRSEAIRTKWHSRVRLVSKQTDSRWGGIPLQLYWGVRAGGLGTAQWRCTPLGPRPQRGGRGENKDKTITIEENIACTILPADQEKLQKSPNKKGQIRQTPGVWATEIGKLMLTWEFSIDSNDWRTAEVDSTHITESSTHITECPLLFSKLVAMKFQKLWNNFYTNIKYFLFKLF